MFGDSQSRVIRRRWKGANLIAQRRSGNDGNNAGMLIRRGRVDAFDARVRMGTSEDGDMSISGSLTCRRIGQVHESD